MPETIPVRVRDCACPDLPHADGDVVFIRAKLSLEGGLAAQQAIVDASGDTNAAIRSLSVAFVRHGAVGANFLDPFEVDDILDDFELSVQVAEACNDRYSEAFLRPLGLTPNASSNGGRTARSTSRRKASHPA